MRLASAVAAASLLLAACAADPVATSVPIPPADGIPPLDTSIADVALDDIVFDTFDGGSVALSQASEGLAEQLLDVIEPVDGPAFESPADAEWLVDDDVVLGYLGDDGRAWAFPVKILDLHELVNAELAGRPVLVTYCPLCGSGIVYDRRLDGRVLAFSNTSALYQNDLVMVDRATGSYWWQTAGRAVVGPLTGQHLEVLPAEMARWADWRRRHPDTAVMARPGPRDYERDRFAGYPDLLAEGQTPFPVEPAAFADDRLAPGDLVVVVEADDGPVAYVGDAVAALAPGTPRRTMYWFAAVATFGALDLVGG